MSIILYPELADYIFHFCTKFFAENETKASLHLSAKSNSYNGKYDFYFKKYYSSEKDVLALFENGYEEFIKNVALRIFYTHKEELDLNLCQKCFKIARTPQAKQCQFCFYSWHKKN